MKLSIITINYNNAAGLKRTLDSVGAQTYADFEHIIVDGASTDGSVEIIRQYADSQAIRRRGDEATRQITWLSEPDTGIYNAMNKGVRMANGEYTLMLNSGDYLVDEYVVEKIMPLLDGTDVIQGNIIEDHPNKVVRNRGYGRSDIDFFDVMKGHFLHQASFCRKDLFEKYGMFDESYRIIGDTKFFMICLGKENASFKYIDIDISNYDLNGISAETTGGWAEKRRDEAARMYHELYSNRLYDFFIQNEKKIKLYNQISMHKWIWYMIMAIKHIHDWFYVPKNDILREKI